MIDEMSTSAENHAGLSSIVDREIDIQNRGLILQPAVFAAVILLLLLLFPQAPWSVRLLLIAGVLLTLKRWGGIVVLVLVQADLFLREGTLFELLQGTGGILLAFTTLSVLMFVARQRLLLLHMARGSLWEIWQRFGSQGTADKTPDAATPVSGMAASVEAVVLLLPSALRGLSVALGCVTAARLILSLIPKNRELTGKLRGLVNADPALTSSGVLLIVLIAGWVIMSEISWRQMNPAQARVFLRSEQVRMSYRDLRMIIVRRIRMRRQRLLVSRTNGKTKSPQ